MGKAVPALLALGRFGLLSRLPVDDALADANDQQRSGVQQHQQAADDAEEFVRTALDLLLVDVRGALDAGLVGGADLGEPARCRLALLEEGRDVGVQLDDADHHVAAAGAHGHVSGDQVAVLDDALEGAEAIPVRQLAGGAALRRGAPAGVLARVLADLPVFRRVEGHATQVEHLDLEHGGALHRRVGLGIQRLECRQRDDPPADLAPAGAPHVQGLALQRLASVDGYALCRVQEGPEVARPQHVGHHARQVDVVGLVHGEQAASRRLLVLAGEFVLRLSEEGGLLLLHLREEVLFHALQEEQAHRHRGKCNERGQREIAHQPEAGGLRTRPERGFLHAFVPSLRARPGTS
jgi:hypothetical protein